MQGRIWLIGLALVCGCGELPAPPAQEAASTPAVSPSFDPANTGTIAGRVVWDGDVPTLEPVVMKVNAYHNCLHKHPVTCVPPHQPKVHQGGVADVVVFLRGVDGTRAR